MNTKTASPQGNAVTLTNGSVSIDGRPILRGANLSVDLGDFVAVMGANGSGKSTMVRALVGLRPLVGGSLELFGVPLDDFDQWHRIGYVPQRANATSGIPVSVREVVTAGRLTRRRLLRPLSRADRAAIDEALEIVGLADRHRDAVGNLSGGQQQRVLIARALAGEPELFFLDEPTAGVDLPNQQALAETLTRLKDRGATIVLVAHELGPLAPLVDRAVVLRDGRVAYDGAPLADHEVHQPLFGGAESHVHHYTDLDGQDRREHAPDITSPIDRTEED